MVPQLDTNFYTSQIFWLIVSLCLLFFAFKKIFVPRINTLINSRDDYIKNLKTEISNLEHQITMLTEKVDNIKKAKIDEENKIIEQVRQECNKELKQKIEEFERENQETLKEIQLESENSLANLEVIMKKQIEELADQTFNKLFPKEP